ncbi:aspartyl protease [Methylomonas koyamae]|uniref:Aspartyl protease n=1 Tax=Methylomonas koyamae TaxID=702114 RepID=A0A177N5K5_9GAMM|nr:retropepsin-like aspartic protease [Methylomonas koyamae]OAI13182.1 aspartyl protease [Methylomonas koyamae]
MGIQDRDYYWERRQAASKANVSEFDRLRRYRQPPTNRSSGNLKYLITPAMILFSLWWVGDKLLKLKGAHLPASPSVSIPAENTPVAMPITGGLEIAADRQGHFRGTLLLNNVPMPFLIDTGATMTSIPARFANAADLPVGSPVNSNTAGGQVIDRLTQINSLKIGNAEIRNLDATINQYLDEVLVGMNTLKYFTITQSHNRMTLVANGSSPDQIVRAPVMSPVPIRPTTLAVEQPIATPEIKRVTKVKKTVNCNSQQVCTTTYSDH